jgi:hypothetical protein
MDPNSLERSERKAFQFKSLKKGIKKWDIFSDSQEYLMCLVGLLGSDAKTDHAVAITGRWIFDSNFKKALPLTKESLDLCCSDDTKKCKWIGVNQVCMLKHIM